MDDIPRKILCLLIRDQGISVINDAGKFRNLLGDYTKGEYKRERKCLFDALFEDVPNTLLVKKDKLTYATLSEQLSQKLINNLGINPELAKWTVDSWAIALDVIPPVDIQQQEFNVSILSNPTGARVASNGIFIGVTPLLLKNPELKTYNFQISFDNYEPWLHTYTLTSRENLTISANLNKKNHETGSITIETTPPNAQIYLNSKKQGRSPKILQNLSEGYFEIRLVLQGYKDIVRQLHVQDRDNVKIRESFLPELEKSSASMFGKFTVNSSPAHAAVYLDDEFVGNTPLIARDILPGNHTVTLRLSSYYDDTDHFYISSGEDHFIQKTLDQQKTSPILLKALYFTAALILIFFLVPFFSGNNSSESPTPQYTPQRPAIITPIPTPVNIAKNLSERAYGDYLQAGQTNTYFFDVPDGKQKINVIKVIAQAKAGNQISSAVGFNYIPSIANQKYDYISVAHSDAVIDINTPKPGRYYVIVTGVKGSSDTRVSYSVY